MNETLYGDVLFLVNFSMDYLTLFLTAKLLHRKVRPLRFTVSAVIGGIYGVAACFMGGQLIFKLIIDIAVSLLMCYISYEKNLLPCCALFYMSGCLLGGAMTAVYSLLNRFGSSKTVFVNGSYKSVQGDIPLGYMAVIAVIAGGIALLLGKFSEKKRAVSEVGFSVVCDGNAVQFHGICDSGNLLTDSLSGMPVIVMTPSAAVSAVPPYLKEIFSDGRIESLTSFPPDVASKVRLIPINTAGGDGILLGYRPERVIIEGVEKDAVIARGSGSLNTENYGGSDALIPASLL